MVPPDLTDWQVPPHLFRRFAIALVGVAAWVIVSGVMIGVVSGEWLGLAVGTLIRVPLSLFIGWRLGKWVFRSPLTFRQSVRVIWRAR